MEAVYTRTKTLNGNLLGFCPGCMHGTAFKLIGEVLEELGIDDRASCILAIGCCGLAQEAVSFDLATAPHGRAAAAATGLKRSNPDTVVFTYQGDGDLASIGLAETIHAANRGENISVIFINNGIYGMTGGQMAPTTPLGMKTSTCPYGRQAELHGYPLNITDMAATLPGTAYVSRQSVHSVAAINKTKRALRHAFENAMSGKGSNLVEVLSTCSAGWKKTPVEANRWMEENIFKLYRLGDLKDQ